MNQAYNYSAQGVMLRSTHDVGVANGVKSLVYGPAGAGKTRLCATAPNPVIFSAEGGLLSLRQFNLPYAEIKTMSDLQQCYNWAISSNEARQFQTIALDSVTEIAEVCLRNEQANTRDGRKAYGELLIKIVGVVRDFRDIPGKHVIITAKQEWAKDDTTGMMVFAPMMPGSKLGPQLPYFFDEVFQQCVFVNQQTKARIEALRTRADNQNVAKDRSGALDEWERPDLNAIYNKIMRG